MQLFDVVLIALCLLTVLCTSVVEIVIFALFTMEINTDHFLTLTTKHY